MEAATNPLIAALYPEDKNPPTERSACLVAGGNRCGRDYWALRLVLPGRPWQLNLLLLIIPAPGADDPEWRVRSSLSQNGWPPVSPTRRCFGKLAARLAFCSGLSA